MDLRASLLAPCKTLDGQLDVGALLQRLLLFDRYIIHSERLSEVPLLIQTFGLEVFLELLRTRALAFECTPISVAQNGSLRGLPHLSYQFDIVRVTARKGLEGDMNADRANQLAPIAKLPNIKKHEALKLRNASSAPFFELPFPTVANL